MKKETRRREEGIWWGTYERESSTKDVRRALVTYRHWHWQQTVAATDMEGCLAGSARTIHQDSSSLGKFTVGSLQVGVLGRSRLSFEVPRCLILLEFAKRLDAVKNFTSCERCKLP